MRSPLAIMGAAALFLTSCALPPLSPPGETPSESTAESSGPTAAPTSPAPTGTLEIAPDRQDVDLKDIELPGMSDAPGDDLQAYLGQKIAWSDCGNLKCADVLAPMDYADPGRRAITLHLAMRPATDGDLGPLFVNPGGPGASGAEMVGTGRWSSLPQYDIVGWDPRGAGDSTPVVCFADQDEPLPQMDKHLNVDTSPDNAAEYEALVQDNRDFAASCAQHSGEWLTHIGTDQTIQDMDLLRQLLGADHMNYVGYSYGTYLGAMYADAYPERVGRMILDSAVNITDDISHSQAEGFDRALANFAEYATKSGRLGSTADEVIGKIRALLDQLDASPMPTSTGRELTQALAVTGIVMPLYGAEETWTYLELGLLAAIDSNDGSILLSLADLLNDRAADGSYGALSFSFPAIACRDGIDYGLDWSKDYWEQQSAAIPFFGHYFGPGATCETWVTEPLPAPDITADGAAPILVIGSTGDPATPYEYAPWMAERLDNAVLLTFDGPGHGSFGGGNSCVDDAGVAYLVDGTVPDDGTVCRP